MFIGLLFVISCTSVSKKDLIVCAMPCPENPNMLCEVECPDGGPLPPEGRPSSYENIVMAELCNDNSDDLCEVE